MKKLIQIGLSSVLVFPVMALGVCAADWADNTTSMVTYFPVPYAAYNNIYVSDKFDVGTSTGSYNLYLGSSGISERALEAEQVILHKTDSSTAQFTMDSDVYTPKAYFGKVAADGNNAVTLEFQNLRLGNGINNIGTLTVDDLTVNELNLFGADLGGAACEGTVQVANVNLGDGSKSYMVCCPTGESCGTPCYFTDAEANSRQPKCLESSGHPAGSWVQNAQPAPKCGCNCPANAYLDANGKCQCNTDYSYSGGSCVLSCSLNWYRESHRAKCCPSYSGSNYSDTICWNLRWALTNTVEECSGVLSSETNGCSNLESYLTEWDYPESPAGFQAEWGDPCTRPNDTFMRVHYSGATCSTDSTHCATEKEYYTCENSINW